MGGDGHKFESRCVAVGEEELVVATRKSQIPGNVEVPRTQMSVAKIVKKVNI